MNDLILGLSLQVTKLVSGRETSPSPRFVGSDGNFEVGNPLSNCDKHSQSFYSVRLTKVDFPKFDGEGLKRWLYRCN